MEYHVFRTGLTFTAVRQLLAYEARLAFEREGRRMFITRATVLGRWHQMKQEMWKQFVSGEGQEL